MFWEEYTPKFFSCWREGFTRPQLMQDLLAGVTIGIISLPLVMAFAIGAGVGPERGLFTAIVAGFLISLLGGSRVQIGGPTGAFIVIIFDIVQRHGYPGLAITTLMAGAILIGMGLLRFGALLKFIPYPVTTGITTGIAINIFSSQVKDFFGLDVDQVPARFLERWALYFQQALTWNPWSFGIAAATLSLIILLRRLSPRFPGVIVAVICATLFTIGWDLPVETIETKFGEIPRLLPAPSFPEISLASLTKLFPDAVTVALLGAIESLLCAHVADGLTGHRHRSNCELVAQGFANIGSVLFGGIPATGAIARTAANVNLGARTPVAGMIHAITLLLLMLLFAPWASLVPLPALAAILTLVAWNMSERHHFAQILKGPWSDIAVLLISFVLTVLVDLTVAVQAGVILAAILFLKHMTDSTTLQESKIAEDLAVFELNGPFFFGVSHLLKEQLRLLPMTPRLFILRMGRVPHIDASGIHALKEFSEKCRRRGIVFCLTELKSEFQKPFENELLFDQLDEAVAYAKSQPKVEEGLLLRSYPT